jgi:mannose-6-phosphate isomerase-like protein (cupin superfamily)
VKGKDDERQDGNGRSEGAGHLKKVLSFWQPVPANGFVRNLFSNTSISAVNKFSLSTQTVAPGCFIREHTYNQNEEIIYVISGKGMVKLDGKEHPIEPGSAVFLGHNRFDIPIRVPIHNDVAMS